MSDYDLEGRIDEITAELNTLEREFVNADSFRERRGILIEYRRLERDKRILINCQCD